MNISVENWSYPIDESIVIDFEKKHNINIPNPYRQFLIDFNVAYVKPRRFFNKHVSQIQSGDEPDEGLDLFRGFSTDEEWCLDWYMDIYIYSGRISKVFLPIAAAAGGNVICIGIAGNNHGKIFFWDHEDEYDGESLTCLADDLNSFLNSLVGKQV